MIIYDISWFHKGATGLGPPSMAVFTLSSMTSPSCPVTVNLPQPLLREASTKSSWPGATGGAMVAPRSFRGAWGSWESWKSWENRLENCRCWCWIECFSTVVMVILYWILCKLQELDWIFKPMYEYLSSRANALQLSYHLSRQEAVLPDKKLVYKLTPESMDLSWSI